MRVLTGLTLAAVALAAAGCGSNEPKVVKVSGVATHKGEPLPGLIITFMPDYGRPSIATTDDQGRFTLDYDAERKGALLGRHTVSAIRPTDELAGTKPHPATKEVVKKYGDDTKSPMKIEISGPAENLELKFD